VTVEDLAAELLEVSLADDPISASLLGIPGYDHRLPDFGLDAQDELVARLGAVATRADGLSADGLDEGERQTLDFVRATASTARDAAALPTVEWTVGDFFAAPVAGVLTMLPKVPLDTDERAEGYLRRLEGLPAMLEGVARRHRRGIANDRVAVARLVRAATDQLDVLLADPAVGGIRRRRDDAFDAEVDRCVDDLVRPALVRYRDELLGPVLAAARDDSRCGLCRLPGGDAMYAVLARRHTSTGRSPEELHATGQDIVAAVADEFSEIGARLWGTPALDAVFDRLRNDPDLRYGSAGEMLDVARGAVGRAEEAAPRWFGTVPDERCLVEPVAEAEEAGSAPAYYLPGAVDGSRRGTYFLNTSKPEERFRHLAEVVAFHEAVPGHHFQLTIALRQTALPLARRVMVDTACAEGWGLYAERLADEMGLYSDDLARLGMLTADAWRAGRLVVDTGLHHLGWGRQQAVDWMQEHTPLATLDIGTEIDRYITYPGQALSYMVGRLEISRLRRHGEGRLGARFDLRAFHDLILEVGALPLAALAGAVERWTEAEAG